MKRGRYNKARNGADNTPKRRPLTLHPLFGTLLGLWGAALGGLVTLVLPRNSVLALAAEAGLAGIGANAPFVLAAIAALVLGGMMFAIAGLVTRASVKARRPDDTPSLAAMAVRHVQMIDPARELGSRSLDEPVATMPFADRKPGFETGAQDAGAASEPATPPPLELDLEEFGALPSRNAVWVEDSSYLGVRCEHPAPPIPEPLTLSTVTDTRPEREPAPAPRPISSSAIERLRAVPHSELSLVQMVERFAAALHEHQSAPAGGSAHRAGQAGRDAALVEALKALAAFSPDESTTAQGEPLRAALARLQELRGAA